MSNRYTSIKEIRKKYAKKLDEWEMDDAADGIENTDNKNKILLCLLAAEGGNFDAFKFLIENGVDPIEGYNYWSPLHYAIKNDNLKYVKYLVEKCGADVNELTGIERPSNVPPLAIAWSNSMIKYLLDNGANRVIPRWLFNQLNIIGIANEANDYIIELLKNHVKDVEVKDEDKEKKIDHHITFENKEIGTKILEEEFKKWHGCVSYKCFPENLAHIEFFNGETAEAKYQEIANKYKIEFSVKYKPQNDYEEPFENEFKPQ